MGKETVLWPHNFYVVNPKNQWEDKKQTLMTTFVIDYNIFNTKIKIYVMDILVMNNWKTT